MDEEERELVRGGEEEGAVLVEWREKGMGKKEDEGGHGGCMFDSSAEITSWNPETQYQ